MGAMILVVAVLSAATGQVLLSRHDLRGLALYGLAILTLVVLLRQTAGHALDPEKHARRPTPAPPAPSYDRYRRLLRMLLLLVAATSALIAYLGAANNTYRWYGVTAWVSAVVLFTIIFLQPGSGQASGRRFGISREGWRLRWTTLLLIGVIVVGAFYRFWQLGDMPSEMTSDHIEKLLDVHDLVSGQRPVFFVRNTGREPWQFYWTLVLMRLFDLDAKFLALKLGTAFVGLLMLPGVYLLGRDLGNHRVGLWAALFSAVASWPVILSRVGLRFPFAPAASAWSLFFLLRGLRDGRRNDFLMLGLCLGIGLHGYTAFRAMPLAVVACWALALLLRPANLSIHRPSFIKNALLTVLIAAVVFIPLGRFALEHPQDFWGRSVSRMTDPVQPLRDGPVVTFAKNLWRIALMFHWKGDSVFVNTLVDAPVLDPLLGALFVLGLVIVVWRGLRLGDSIPLLLLVAGSILLLPSALSVAFPVENPSVVRAGGAIPVVMTVAALPLGLSLHHRFGLGKAAREEPARVRSHWRQPWMGVLVAVLLAANVIAINYRRYFVDYWSQYETNALNTTEIASAVRGFAESGGSLENAWIVAWPYWIDTRGVGIELGDPQWNNVILDREKLNQHAETALAGQAEAESLPRFYVLHSYDVKTLTQLQTLFPSGWSRLYTSEHPYRDFVLFYVPAPPADGVMQETKGEDIYAPLP